MQQKQRIVRTFSSDGPLLFFHTVLHRFLFFRRYTLLPFPGRRSVCDRAFQYKAWAFFSGTVRHKTTLFQNAL